MIIYKCDRCDKVLPGTGDPPQIVLHFGFLSTLPDSTFHMCRFCSEDIWNYLRGAD